MGGTSSTEKKIEAEEVTDQDGGDHYGPEFLPIHVPSVGSTFASMALSVLLVAAIYLAVRKCLHRYGGLRRARGRRSWDDIEHGHHAYPFEGVELQPRHQYAGLGYYGARPLPARPLPALYAPGADAPGRIYEVVNGDAHDQPAKEAVGAENEPAYVAPARAGKVKSLILSDAAAVGAGAKK